MGMKDASRATIQDYLHARRISEPEYTESVESNLSKKNSVGESFSRRDQSESATYEGSLLGAQTIAMLSAIIA